MKNNSDDNLVLNTYAVMNQHFFSIQVFDSLGVVVSDECGVVKMNYRRIFEKPGNYTVLGPNKERRWVYTTWGCPQMGERKFRVAVAPGRYSVCASYQVPDRSGDLLIRNPAFMGMWTGEVVSDTVRFFVD